MHVERRSAPRKKQLGCRTETHLTDELDIPFKRVKQPKPNVWNREDGRRRCDPNVASYSEMATGAYRVATDHGDNWRRAVRDRIYSNALWLADLVEGRGISPRSLGRAAPPRRRGHFARGRLGRIFASTIRIGPGSGLTQATPRGSPPRRRSARQDCRLERCGLRRQSPQSCCCEDG